MCGWWMVNTFTDNLSVSFCYRTFDPETILSLQGVDLLELIPLVRYMNANLLHKPTGGYKLLVESCFIDVFFLDASPCLHYLQDLHVSFHQLCMILTVWFASTYDVCMVQTFCSTQEAIALEVCTQALIVRWFTTKANQHLPIDNRRLIYHHPHLRR